MLIIKRLLILLLLLDMHVCIFAQKNVSSFVSKRNYKGYIFSKEYFIPVYNDRRCDLSDIDIRKVEKIIHDYSDLGLFKKKLTSRKYIRQYFGFLNDKGHKIVYVNFIRFKIAKFLPLATEYQQIYDSDIDNWNTFIDINESKVLL